MARHFPLPDVPLTGDYEKDLPFFLELIRNIKDMFNADLIPHGGTHNPGESDEIATAEPSSATGVAADAGSASTLLRSDAVIKQGIVTTKGDILGFSTVPVRVPIGATNGHVATVASGETAGWKWAAAGASDTDESLLFSFFLGS